MNQTSKRYFEGREVLISAKCCNRIDYGDKFMSYDHGQS